MAYFPFFIDLAGKQGLIVGGGSVALRKVQKLLPFGPQLHVVAEVFSEAFEALSGPQLSLSRRPFQETDLDGCFFVIAATDDAALNARIAAACRQRGILINAADDAKNCSFLFPALLKEGALVAGVTTGGASPYAAAEAKNRLMAALPQNMGDLLDQLAALRKEARERLADGKQRAALLREAAAQCLQAERKLTEAEVETLFLRYETGRQGEGSRQRAGSGRTEAASVPMPMTGCDTAECSVDKNGSVVLVGAGCGAYDSITLRGLRALRTAEVLLYDDLLDPRLLAFVPEHCDCIYVGKRLHAHSMPQEEINQLLLRFAKAGKRVVRLKGGDPFVFGRGGEEAEALQKAGISVTVIPGVSSAVAMPELAGIPLTFRGKSRGFLVMTAHVREQAADSRESMQETGGKQQKQALGSAQAAEASLPEGLREAAAFPGTRVFLMGLSLLEQLAQNLMDNGLSPKTPAAVIHGAADGSVETVRGTLMDIAARTREAKLPAPAVIVVGETADYTKNE